MFYLPGFIVALLVLLFASLSIIKLCNRKDPLEINICENCLWIYFIIGFLCTASFLAVFVLLFHKYIQYLSKQNEADAKLKEKMLNVVVDAFHEDREYSRLRTKTEISLHEKLEKARIDEWCRNNEHKRKLIIMEQERIAELSNVLKELAKTMNKVTIVDNQDKGKTITVERSILCEDCCNEIKEMVNAALKE